MEEIQIQMLEKEEENSLTPVLNYYPYNFSKTKSLNDIHKMDLFPHLIEIDSNRIEMFRQLLCKLGMEKTLNIFNAEVQKTNNVRNPEQSGKKQGYQAMQRQVQTEYLSQLVQQSSSLQQMLQQMKIIMANQSQSARNSQNKFQYQKLTRMLQELFGIKATATIPIFTIFNLELNDRTILFIDINAIQAVCLLDSRNCLHVIDHRQNLVSSKIESKRDITVLGMKWMNQREFVIGTDTHKFLIYSSSNLQLLKIVRPGKMKISYLDMHNIYSLNCNSLIIIAQSISHYTVITKLSEQKELRLEKKDVFNWGDALKDSAVLKIKHCEEFKHYINQQVKFSVTNAIEHYYGLNCASKAIVKFDTLTNQAGIIWKAKHSIVLMMVPSICRYYLHLILNRQKSPLSNSNDSGCHNYQYIKIDGHGSTITRVPLDLNNVLMGQKIGKILMLDSDWLCCTALNNRLIYFSICTGKIVYIQRIIGVEKGGVEQLHFAAIVKLNKVNCICVSIQSTKLRETKKLSLEYEMVEEQDEVLVLLQSARIRGIPRNFLHFLQSIRNQQR